MLYETNLMYIECIQVVFAPKILLWKHYDFYMILLSVFSSINWFI